MYKRGASIKIIICYWHLCKKCMIRCYFYLSAKNQVVYSVTYIGMERFLGKRYVAYLGTTSQKKQSYSIF